MAGYLLQGIPSSDCDNCQDNHVSDVPPAANDMYIFISEKAYKETGTLVYPTENYIRFVEHLESLFMSTFPQFQHMSSLMSRHIMSDKHIHCDEAKKLFRFWSPG